MPDTLLHLKNIRKHYQTAAGRLDVLKGVELVVPQAAKIGIVGRSGSGKSTLLHLAGLLDKASSGDVIVMGKSAASLADDDRSRIRNEFFGFVYQHHHLLREFDAFENIAMPARIGGSLTESQIRARATELLDAVGLSARKNHYPAQLSGGEQQRVALARALMNHPKILLADEPTGNLDAETAEQVTALLDRLVAKHGMTVILVTHNIDLARHCDTICHMRDGHLEQQASSGA